MKTQILNMALLSGAFLSLFGAAEILYHFAKVKGEWTRKLVHVGTGLLTLLFPIYLESHWQVLLLCACFAGILSLSLKFDFLKSINDIDRKSHGSLAFPLAVYGCFLVYELMGNADIYFYLPILTLAICDPLAAIFGKKYPYGQYKIGDCKKTIVGSGMFFGAAMLIAMGSFYTNNLNFTGLEYLAFGGLVAMATTITEGVSGKGLDNITIPIVTILSLCMIETVKFIPQVIAFAS